MDDTTEVMDDYKVLANNLKDEANAAFQKGEIENSIQLYSQAIDIDPDNHVIYSNRSAAYMKIDSISKALKDAEKCLELNPSFIKGYSRLGVAQQTLKRYDVAIETFKKGIKLDPSNTTLWSALSACQEAYEKDKTIRYADAAKERNQEEERLRKADEEKMKQEQLRTNQKLSDFLADIDASTPSSSTLSSAPSSSSSINATTSSATTSSSTDQQSQPPEDDLLSGFFSEISSNQTKINEKKEAILTATAAAIKAESKYANQDLGDAKSQFLRLTQKNYEWRNLNPFYVLQLGIDATDDDIKQRYKNLSRRVHPDKLLDMENAREAFEQVKSAYHKLQDEKQKNVVVMNIEYIRDEMNKERRRLISKGMKESTLPDYDAELERRTIKHFAEIEMQRRRSETNLRFYNTRDRIQEDSEKELVRLQEEKEKAWAEVERREKRVGEWRNFQEDPDSKKVRVASYKEEHRTVAKGEEKHGKVELEGWKKSWK